VSDAGRAEYRRKLRAAHRAERGTPPPMIELFARPDWQAFAACRGSDRDVFFPSRGEAIGEAVAICQGCPVRAECLEYALINNEQFGVWGGLSERQRKRIRARRRDQQAS
jgi:WhiB family redox-sensing transcriptional regulator